VQSPITAIRVQHKTRHWKGEFFGKKKKKKERKQKKRDNFLTAGKELMG